jgi:fructose-1,6-bisphosphatase II
MLYIGEKVGGGQGVPGDAAPKSTRRRSARGHNLCATGEPNAMRCLAASSKGGPAARPESLHGEADRRAPPRRVDLDAPVATTSSDRRSLGRASRIWSSWCSIGPRHETLIADIRAAGARIRLIPDGTWRPASPTAVAGSGVHAVMGTGGAPEGVLTAAAMRCLHGEILGRLVIKTPEHEERCRAMGSPTSTKVYTLEDLASGDRMIFAATGVTDGALMKGVRFFGDGVRTSSVVMQSEPARIRFIDTIHIRAERGRPLLIDCGTTCHPGSATSSPVPRRAFVGFTGFTVVMPFLPLYLQQLGVEDVGRRGDVVRAQPRRDAGGDGAAGAVLGRVSDRFGRKIMVERSLVSFVSSWAAMAYATQAWHVFALRAVQGLFAGYGGIALTMAAESAPPDRTAYAIGTVQTAQRLGPALGPVIGGAVAQVVGPAQRLPDDVGLLRRGARHRVLPLRGAPRPPSRAAAGAEAIRFKSVLAFENFILLMAVIFGLQLVDRSYGPILPLYVAQLGTPPHRVPLIAGIIFSVAAGAGAVGNQLCTRLLRWRPARTIMVVTALTGAVGRRCSLSRPSTPAMFLATPILGLALGVSRPRPTRPRAA